MSRTAETAVSQSNGFLDGIKDFASTIYMHKGKIAIGALSLVAACAPDSGEPGITPPTTSGAELCDTPGAVETAAGGLTVPLEDGDGNVPIATHHFTLNPWQNGFRGSIANVSAAQRGSEYEGLQIEAYGVASEAVCVIPLDVVEARVAEGAAAAQARMNSLRIAV